MASLRGTFGHVAGQYSGQLITCALGAVGAGLGAWGTVPILAKLLAIGIAAILAGGKNVFN
jgi:hypothetical protein